MSEPNTLDVGGPARRFHARSAGILLLVGTVLTIVSSFLQQRQNIPRGDPLGLLDYIAGRPWFAAALVGVLGMLCWTVAFVAAGRALVEPISRSVAQLAESLLVIAAVLFTVTYAHDGFSSGVLAQHWTSGQLDADAAVRDARVIESLVGGTSVLYQTILGIALALYAVAMLRSGQYSRVLSGVGTVGTLGWCLGGAALFLRLPGMSFELLLPFVALTLVWTVGTGVSLLRQSLRR